MQPPPGSPSISYEASQSYLTDSGASSPRPFSSFAGLRRRSLSSSARDTLWIQVASAGGAETGCPIELDPAPGLSALTWDGRTRSRHPASSGWSPLPCLIWEGDWDGARRCLDQPLQLARSMHLEPPYRVALAHLAELDLLEGRPDAAVARLAPFERADLTWTDGALLHAILAGAYVALGDLARAEPVADRAVAEARRMGTWIHGIGALRIQALVEARRGKVEQARKTLEDGLQRARCMPFPYGEARLLEAYALLERH